MPREEWVDAVSDALELLGNMVVFYWEYHLLEAVERAVVVHELVETQQSFLGSKKLIKQHVDIIKWRVEDLIRQFEEWMTDEMVARKVWHVHPRDKLKLIVSKAEKITVKMENVITQGDPRRYSSGSWCDPAESSKKNSFNLSAYSMFKKK
jgi:hypothetical protein